MLTYADFMISRSKKGFRIRSGLINKKEKFVPFRKIQFVSWKANWIRKKIGLFLLRFHATGADHVKNKMQGLRIHLDSSSHKAQFLQSARTPFYIHQKDKRENFYNN